MDQDIYEQIMRVQISLDELKEKIEYLTDEIDELKDRAEKPCGDTQEKSCGCHCPRSVRNRWAA